MANIYDHLKSLISSEMISKAATELGENNEQVGQTVKNVVPALLGGFLDFGDKKKVQDIIEEAHSKNVLSDVPGLFVAFPEAEKTGIGERFISAIFGEKETALHSLVAEDGIMSNANTKKLLAMIGTVVAGVLGKHLSDHNGSMPKLFDELADDQTDILAAIPADYKAKLGIKEVKRPVAAPKREEPKKKRGLAWLWWLLGIIVLLLLLCWVFGCFKSCCSTDKAPVEAGQTVPAIPVESNTYELTLNTGEKLTVTKGSMIDKMVVFLRSDKYKNATDEDLKKNWFEFENLDFVFNSSTEFVEGSDQCLNCLAFVLKYFPEAKIKIGGNADHKGTEGVNLAISKERAATIKNRLVGAGITANRISTEGFGEEYAVIPATATDAERAPDRDIALRFVK